MRLFLDFGMEIKDYEEQILKFWKENKTFEKSLELTKKGKPYIFYDGPPFATGMPHYGHILSSVVKDLFARYWTMHGRYVRRVWGWDCHGLPIENIAEKGLNINSKDEIEKMGVKKFNDYCRSKVMSYADAWVNEVDRIGRWVDMKNCYKTMDNSYIESVWWAFKQLWEKDYIYQGEKILMYCPRCSTPLSKSEIAMDNSYKTLKESSIVIKFKLEEKINEKEVFALAWTTTPWTLISNLALTVNPDLEYLYLLDKKDDVIYILAKDLIENFYKNKDDYKIIKTVLGRELENKKFVPLFNYFKDTKNAFKILLAEFVTAEDGTGIVHTAPNFGEDDYDVCKKYDIGVIDSVDEKGLFKEIVSDFKGEYIHDSNEKIIDFLRKRNDLVLVKKIEHEYPFCYRCDTKLMYRAIPAWFVNIQKIKPRLLELNNKLNWYPEFLKQGRVKYTLETAPDWNISRNRYWATAIPIWESDDGERLVIGSIEELKKYAKNLHKEEIDLHKDYLDEIILVKDNKEFKRVPEVLDCWFESGSMTFAQFHYPFENKDFFEKNFPAQFVAEYIGQVRAWFYYMNVLSAILFDDIPFENVVTTGTILSEDGQKMSKSKNNYPDPRGLIDKYGVDAMRFYLMNSPVMNADNLNFSVKGVEEAYKKVLLLMYNVNKFYSSYKLEGVLETPQPKKLIDKWMISRLNDFVKNVTCYLEEYNTVKATNEIKNFVDDLSTWYVRLNRDRFNDEERDVSIILRFVLDRLAKVCAPIIPFTSEVIYHNIYSSGESVHLSSWPEYSNIEETKLLENMNKIKQIVSDGLKERDKNQIGLKWPLNKAIVSGIKSLNEEETEIIKSELNVKEIKLMKGDFLKVELDLKLTENLEREGYAREITRKIQAGRKKAQLTRDNQIKLYFDKDFCDYLGEEMKLILEKVNAIELVFEKNHENLLFEEKGKIKEKEYFFGFLRV